MQEQLATLQQELATSPTPAEPFSELSRVEKHEVFFGLPDAVRERVVRDVDRDRLREVVDDLDPDEATDLLGCFVFLGLAQPVLL